MSARAEAVAKRLAADLEDLRELDTSAPDDCDAIVLALVAHLRAWKPVSIAPLGTLPPAEAPNVDPRGDA